MKTKVQKWGNSLAVRIPLPIAKELNLSQGEEMDITSSKGQIVLEPSRKEYVLKDLVSQITEENSHGETDTGPSAGRESW
jgi:antitoxin MazE